MTNTTNPTSTENTVRAMAPDCTEFTTGLVPMTYAEATKLFLSCGKRSFSFIASPVLVSKTVVQQGSVGVPLIVAIPPTSFSPRYCRGHK